MTPPPAEPFASRLFLGPALRTQPDRRLVTLVREGYESAFEEIVRRYRKPLDRFAAAIVGGRSEDVTQDAFSKALLALRGSRADIELKPWLYRIVRNTALNDLRDGPPPALELELGEGFPGAPSAAIEAERREEIAELMSRLRSLPEPQRAAIVMRELEGLSHQEIATALGVSGGAARQAIYRARAALRDGLGLLVPLPLLRVLFDHVSEAAGAGAGGTVAAAGAASAAGGGGGAALGALGAFKLGVATALIAGSLGAGVAMQHQRDGGPGPDAASAATLPGDSPGGGHGGSGSGSGEDSGHGDRRGPGGGYGPGDRGHGDGSDGGRHGAEDSGLEDSPSGVSSHSGSGSGHDDSGAGGHGSGHDDRSGHDGGSGEVRSDSGGSGGSLSGHHSSGDDGSGSSSSSDGHSGGSGSGSGSSGGGGDSFDSSGSGSGDPSGSGSGSGSGSELTEVDSPEPTEAIDEVVDSSGSGSGSGSGDSSSVSGGGSGSGGS
jgi:RNA polymerase sigma factor (sigma-70 family)